MKKCLHAPRRERRVVRWRALAAVACALLLVLLAGPRVPSRPDGPRAPSHTGTLASRMPRAPERPHEVLDAWNLGRSLADATRADPRFDPRPALVPSPRLELAARARSPSPREDTAPAGRPANRPTIAHCPAQGPPPGARLASARGPVAMSWR